MSKERLLKKRYKRAIRKAKCTVKAKSLLVSVWNLITGKNTLKGMRKHWRNIKKPFYTFESIQGLDYKS